MEIAKDKNNEINEFCEKYGITLNEQQKQAVQAVDGANLLLAVPGSGKTTVLVARLGYMILCKNIPPEKILAMTYTTAATHDMRERFSSFFGKELGEKLEFRTINGVSEIIIRRYAKKIGKPPFHLVSDDKEKIKTIKTIYTQCTNEFPTENDIIETETAISYIKNMMLREDEIELVFDSIPKIGEMYKTYQAHMKSNRLMDYDDQMVYAYNILKRDEALLREIQEETPYISVDEAQDTSKIQHEIIHLLVGENNNIFMVGDEDQSIYGFRAAYPQALMNFKDDYKNATILLMEHNYRSTETIVSTAAGFIAKNKHRHEKKLISNREKGNPIDFIHVRNRFTQCEHLLEVAQNHDKNTAILYRDNDSAVPLVDMMLRKNIPYKIRNFKAKFFTNKVVLDIISFLKFANNPYDADAFKAIYYKCGYGFNKNTCEWACQKSKRERISIPDALIEQLAKWPRLQRKAYDFSTFISEIKKLSTLGAIDSIYSSKYEDYMEEMHLDFGKIDLLKILAYSEPDQLNFLKRLDELATQLEHNQRSGDDDAIILSTIHSSKGLEYDSVYIMDVYDNLFPSVDAATAKRHPEKADEYQEERRLFYVAITRAKNKLHIMAIDKMHSSFINEISSK